MQDSDKQKFSEMITAAWESHGKTASPMLMQLWWSTLAKYDMRDVERALHATLMQSEYLPKIADIVNRIEGSGSDQANNAWAKVKDAMQHPGRYATVAFDDPLIHACIERMGGWIKLGDMRVDEQPFRAQEFKKQYEGFKRVPPEDYPGKLIGIHEANDAQTGYKLEREVALIGNVEKAKLISMHTGSNRTNVKRLGDSVGSALKMIGSDSEGSAA